MRRHLQLACIALLLIIVGSHVSEIFDQWDRTLQTGNDIESVIVVLALTAGAALATALSFVVTVSGKKISRVSEPPIVNRSEFLPVAASFHSPPLVPLRI